MKTTLISFYLVFLLLNWNTTTNAQIPNSGFEIWDGVNLVSWATSNIEGNITVMPSSNPLSGNYSVRLIAKSLMNNLIPSVISAGNDGEGFPVNQRHQQVSLYYKFSKTISTAYLVISVGFKKGDNGIGSGVIAISEPSENYVPITIPVTYVTDDIPDLGVILIQVTDQNLNPLAAGSYAEIDDISFNIISDVNDVNPGLKNFSLEQNYPNPFNPSTKIRWYSSSGSWTTLKVFNLLGHEVATLVNEYKPAGIYETEFNAAHFSGLNLSSGVYFYQLKTDKFIETKRMILMK
ncbi:MAG: hypothetical protein KatS3mg036_1085 [Ignavibacterium sp.]|nr:MAG: hypothetical protein KatS3mg036_1085 [Ignavibacterium sp.]